MQSVGYNSNQMFVVCRTPKPDSEKFKNKCFVMVVVAELDNITKAYTLSKLIKNKTGCLTVILRKPIQHRLQLLSISDMLG